jgi:hypothetical protein
MLELLGEITLRNRVRAALAVVTAPEAEDGLGVRPLLGHKGGLWQRHIDRALSGELDGLETRFHLAVVDGQAVTNVMTVEYAGAGILGHVFTKPEHRRLGLCDVVLDMLGADFCARGGWRLLLHTGYDSTAYHIYRGHGFKDVTPGTGFMAWVVRPEAAERWYDAEPARVAPYTWRHWPALGQLLADDFGDGLQALWCEAFGPTCFEFPGLQLQDACEQGAQAVVLEAEDGRALALASLVPDRRWRGVRLLDLVGAPGTAEHWGELLAALDLSGGQVQAWMPAAATARRAAIEARGLRQEALLRDQLGPGGDVVVYGCG